MWGLAQLFPESPFGSGSQREGKRWPVSMEGATRVSISQDAGGDREAEGLKEFAAYLKWILHGKPFFPIL